MSSAHTTAPSQQTTPAGCCSMSGNPGSRLFIIQTAIIQLFKQQVFKYSTILFNSIVKWHHSSLLDGWYHTSWNHRILPPPHASTMPCCHHHVMLPPCHAATTASCHHRHAATIQCCHHAVLPPCHAATTACYHPHLLPPCHADTTACCHHRMLPPPHPGTTHGCCFEHGHITSFAYLHVSILAHRHVWLQVQQHIRATMPQNSDRSGTTLHGVPLSHRLGSSKGNSCSSVQHRHTPHPSTHRSTRSTTPWLDTRTNSWHLAPIIDHRYTAYQYYLPSHIGCHDILVAMRY